MMLKINRAGYNFAWAEMMQMPISRLRRYELIAEEYFKAEKAAYQKKK